MLELDQELLEDVKRKPQPLGPIRDALGPVFADDPVPQGPVEIHHERLPSRLRRIHQIHGASRRVLTLFHGQGTACAQQVPPVERRHRQVQDSAPLPGELGHDRPEGGRHGHRVGSQRPGRDVIARREPGEGWQGDVGVGAGARFEPLHQPTTQVVRPGA